MNYDIINGIIRYNGFNYICKILKLNVDKVYENFVRQIAGDKLQTKNEESLKDSVARDKQRQNLQKQINKLQKQIRQEKQLNKQIQMNAILKRMRKELDSI